MKNYEDKIYSLGETVTGQTQTMSQAEIGRASCRERV